MLGINSVQYNSRQHLIYRYNLSIYDSRVVEKHAIETHADYIIFISISGVDVL